MNDFPRMHHTRILQTGCTRSTTPSQTAPWCTSSCPTTATIRARTFSFSTSAASAIFSASQSCFTACVRKKKAIIVSNTEQAFFRAALSQQSDSMVDILFLRAKDFGRISLRGDLMEEQSVRERVASFVAGNT
ncbi:MAG: hypothetical protein ACI3VP_05975 [Oscillospiraceae bacterium]